MSNEREAPLIEVFQILQSFHAGDLTSSQAADAIMDIKYERSDGLRDAANWLRRQANAEKEPKARAAFIEAHNAILGMAQPKLIPNKFKESAK